MNRKMEIKKKQMYNKLRQADEAYYNKSESIMTDKEYDDLKDEYNSLFQEKYVYVGISVGVTQWEKAKHDMPMGSLDKVNTEEQFRKWAEKLGNEFIIEDKLDGCSLELKYKDGKLYSAITRGDGTIGEDIFENAKKMKNVKLELEDFTGSLRAEVFLFQEDFEKINEILRSSGKKELKNPRNGANGIAKRYDGTFSEYLSVLYYGLQNDQWNFETEEQKMKFISEVLKLETCFWKKVTIDECIKVYEEYEKSKRIETKYDIDGLVIKTNSLKLQDQLGSSDGRPKSQIAWKFEHMNAETEVEDIEWSHGTTGRVNPVAILKAVDIGGVTVRRATLHNLTIFKNLNLGKGDKVLISRRNDVIPYVEAVIEHIGEKFEIPEYCSICKEKLEVVIANPSPMTTQQSEFLACKNQNCSGLLLGNLNRWIYALDIKDIGEKTIKALYEANKIKDASDFYYLKISDISNLERMGEKSATKVLKNLNEKKTITLPQFIAGLNMLNFSSATAEILIDAGYDTIDKMLDAQKDELIKVKGIEEKIAKQILKGLNSKVELIKKLFDAGIKIKEIEKIEVETNVFEGKSFCFTGAIQKETDDGKRYTRKMMEELVIKNGGNISSVKKGLDHLVMADPNSTSAKAQNARSLGINILSEKDFFKFLEKN